MASTRGIGTGSVHFQLGSFPVDPLCSVILFRNVSQKLSFPSTSGSPTKMSNDCARVMATNKVWDSLLSQDASADEEIADHSYAEGSSRNLVHSVGGPLRYFESSS